MLADGGATGSVENAAATVTCWASDKVMPHASATPFNFFCLPMTFLPPNDPKMIANLYECKFVDLRFKCFIFLRFSGERCESVAERHQFGGEAALFWS